MTIAQSEPFKVFWQPGCSSCLRTKEFLTEHGVPFQSIDVLNDEGGMEAMAVLGVRTVPIVSRGRDYVSGQILRDVAAFTGVAWGRAVLPVEDLRTRIDGIMAGALRFAAQLPEAELDVQLPDRPRSYRDLACHIFQIVEAFVEEAEGDPSLPVRGIASIRRIALVRLEGDGMVGVPGFAMRLFGYTSSGNTPRSAVCASLERMAERAGVPVPPQIASTS